MHARACTDAHTPTRPDTHERAQTHAHKYVIFIAFPRKQCLANAPQYYVIRTLRVLFRILALVEDTEMI